MDYDDVMKDLGKLSNKYQFFIFFILMYRNQRNDFISFLFMEEKPVFFCDWNTTLARRNITLLEGKPFSNTSQPKCDLTMGNKSIECTKWEYKSYSSVISEFDLVCGREYILNLMQGSLWVGISFGFLLAILSDKFGRRKVIIITNTLDIIFSTLLIFCSNPWMFMVLRFLIGITTILMTITFSYFQELINSESRVIAGNCWWLFWIYGYCVMPLWAYILPYWRHLQAIHIAMLYPTLLYPLFIPESPRWLISKDRTVEAQTTINWLCKKNNIPKISIKNIKIEENLLVLNKRVLSNKYIIYRFLFCIYLWFSLRSIYNGLSFSLTYSMDNPYLNIFAMGISEAPSIPLGYFLSKYLGYRVALYITIGLTGVTILIIPFIKAIAVLRAILGIIAKVSVTASFTVSYIYCCELFPTQIRSTGLNISSITYIVGFLIPYINTWAEINYYIPSVLYATIALISCIFIIPFPETMRRPMPESIEDMPTLEWKIFKKIRKTVMDVKLELKNYENQSLGDESSLIVKTDTDCRL